MAGGRHTDRPDFDRLGDLLPSGASGPGARPRDPAMGAPGGVPGGALGDPGAPSASVAHPGLLAGDDLGRVISMLWAEVAGAEVAANARPVQFREGRLVVATSSSAWAQTLQLMSPLVIERLNARLGAEAVTKAVFRHAGWDAAFAGAGEVTGPDADRRGAGGAGAARGAGSGVRGRGGRKAAAPPALPHGSRAEKPIGPEGGATRSGGEGAAPRGSQGESLEDLSAEERQALADLDALPLASAVKDGIREAMKAGFARARQDSGRS